METFAEYILSEKNLSSKMEIMYYLSKKTKVFFDKSVVLKTEIARIFVKYLKLDIDENLLLTTSLLCNCKKVDNAQEIDRIHSYAKDGAEYLATMGFDEKFCKICEEINRYSESYPREKESDILELIDQFGGMLLDRPERPGYKPEEALILLEHRNLKDKENAYLDQFIEFVKEIEKIEIHGRTNMSVLRRLVKIYKDYDDIMKFIKEVVEIFQPQVEEKMNISSETLEEAYEELIHEEEMKKYDGDLEKEIISSKVKIKPGKTLFSEETTRKILNKINCEILLDIE